MIDSKVTKTTHSAGLNLFAGSITLVFAVIIAIPIFLFIPFIGWIAGPTIVVAALMTMFKNATYSGNCPYCGLHIKLAADPEKVGVCSQCRNKHVHRSGSLLKIDK